MSIFGTRSSKNVLDYASGYMYLAKNDTDSASASTYAFNLVGWTQGTKITNELETFSEIDDSGQIVVQRDTVKSVMIEGTFLERTADIRNHTLSGNVDYYTMIIVGANLDSSGTTVRECWVFPKVTFSQAIDYEIGGKARIGFKATAFAPDTAIVTDVPSTAEWDIAATNFTVPADQFYLTSDETKA